MDGTESTPQSKISLPEGILITFVLGIIDLIELVIFFFALDDFWIADAVSSVIFFYLFIKGIPPLKQLIAWIAELIPYVGALPLLTLGWVITWWIDAHPESKVGQAISTAASFAPSAKGGVGKVGGGITEATATGATTAATAAKGAEEASEVGSKVAEGAKVPSEEALGMPKEPIEKMKEIMENLPKPQLRTPEEKEYNEEDDFQKAA